MAFFQSLWSHEPPRTEYEDEEVGLLRPGQRNIIVEDDDEHQEPPAMLGTLFAGVILMLLFFNTPALMMAAFFCFGLAMLSCLRMRAFVREAAEADSIMLGMPAQGAAPVQNGNATQQRRHAAAMRFLQQLTRHGVVTTRSGQTASINPQITPQELEVLMALGGHPTTTITIMPMPVNGAPAAPAVQPISDEDMATLPVHSYKRPQGGGSSSTSTEEAPAAAEGAAGSSGQEQQQQEQTCPICLENLEDGEMVLTLPCFHMFHRDCVVPWLQSRGRQDASCPNCKTQVFAHSHL